MNEERFWSKVDRRSDGECWPWTGAKDAHGYGMAWVGDRTVRAHRVALELATGEPLRGLHALHSCDNPPCCNPSHLRAGTHAENMSDRKERDRGYRPRGELAPLARLTETEVAEIRHRHSGGERSSFIARSFGITRQHVWQIAKGNRWS